jgi:DNA-binding CsgD family transcriptional regulator
MDDEQLAKLEEMFLAAAFDPDLWQQAIQHLSDLFGATGGAILPVEGRGPGLISTEAIGELFEQYQREAWYLRDSRYAGIPKLKAAGIIVDQDIFTAEEMASLPLYQDLLARNDLQWFAGLKVAAADNLWCLTLQRRGAGGPFYTAEQQQISRCIGLISRAATLSLSIDNARLDGLRDALDQVSHASVLVNRWGRAIRCNIHAERAIARGVLNIRQGEIVFPAATNETFAAHLRAALAPDIPADHPALDPLTVARRGERPLLLQVQRLRGRAFGPFATATALVNIKEIGARDVVPEHLLKTTFDLSPKEARLAKILAKHQRLTTAAIELKVSRETLRSQLKSVFDKTGTRSQSELLLLMSTMSF